MKPQDYQIDIQPLSEDDGGGFVATVPALPGCMSDGDSPEEALSNAYDAVACWIEASEKAGRAIPAARVYA
jgi:antitoxin HicB